MNEQFTKEQLANFKAYLRVQKSNRYNMLDPRARQATNLSREEYLFVLENYDALRAQFEAKTTKEGA